MIADSHHVILTERDRAEGRQMAIRTERQLLLTQPACEADAFVEARAIDKLYDTGQLQVHALRGVSMVVRRGEMVAIRGGRLRQDDAPELPVRA
jgi:ABC-type glutathione transport system ATPase component